MPRLNRNVIQENMAEAIEELQRLLAKLAAGKLDESEYEVGMQHAFHHLNFAWNTRYWPMKRHKKLSKADFKKGSQYPRDLETF